MFGFLFNAPAWQLVAQADVMTKFVLLALFILYIFCFSIALSKLYSFFQEKKAMMALQKKLKKAKSLEDLIVLGKEYRDYSAGKFLINSLSELKDLLSLNNNDSLSREEIQHLQLMLDQNLDKVLSEQEEYLPVLGTSAAVSPLIGLFGTVWGLIHAFVSISQQRSADLAVLAPGIAEALTTTLAGLIVAIPSLIFFYYFTNELRKIEQKLWVVSDRFLMVVKNTFI